MPKLPVVKPRDLIQVLKQLGFTEDRQKGSHLIMKHQDSRRAIVPIHNKDIPKGTLNGILKDNDISLDKLIKYL